MSDAERPDLPQSSRGPQDAAPGPEHSGSRPEAGPGPGMTPGPAPTPDADAWATACAEDLSAEKARRRTRQGMPPGSAAEELRRLMDAVAERLTGLSGTAAPLFGMAAQGAARHMVQQVVQQAKAAVDPVIEHNPDIFDHLAAAGSELLAAYRSAVSAQEQRWTRGSGLDVRDGGTAGDGPADHDDHPGRPGGHKEGPDRPDGGPEPGEHIDLD